LNKLWTQALRQSRGVRIRKVSITLSDLVAATDLQPDLFASLPDADLAARSKSERLSRAKGLQDQRFVKPPHAASFGLVLCATIQF
jgi:hypothetical protein